MGQGLVAWVVVLGDFGRSPRMQYHALSLCAQRDVGSVHVLAFPGAEPLPALIGDPKFHFTPMKPCSPRWLGRLPRTMALIVKVLVQILQLLWLMVVALPQPHILLVQTPPAIPTLALCWLASARHRAALVIDWHNYGYTILAMGLGQRHWMVRAARWYERRWARAAHAHLCVTKAMQRDLADTWGIQAHVLYDRPPAFFARTPLSDLHALLLRLGCCPDWADPTANDFLSRWLASHGIPAGGDGGQGGSPCGDSLVAVVGRGGQIQPRVPRPALLISSTSWTPDEDFSILLAAAQLYEAEAGRRAGAAAMMAAAPVGPTPPLPDVVIIVTGKGPQRDQYLRAVRGLALSHVSFRFLWLEAADYPTLLGGADIGISLHASSSGLDLPMKVVDMFGSGLPVCALAYSCIGELVAEGETGMLFSSAAQLAGQLVELLAGFPAAPSPLLSCLQQGVAAKEQALRWDANWDAVAWPLLRQAVESVAAGGQRHFASQTAGVKAA